MIRFCHTSVQKSEGIRIGIMHQSILLAFIATSFIVYTLVSAEQCTVNGDCNSTGCASGYHVICEHPAGAGITTNGGLCTCAVDNLSCTNQQDCQAYNVTYYQCISASHKHCYDGKCICTRWR